MKIDQNGDARNGDVSSNVEQKSQLINGPHEFSISTSSRTPWKGKLRFSNIVHGSFQTSSINSHVDGVLSDSKKNVDEDSKVFLVVTFRARMAKKALKTLDNNNGIQKST